MTYRKLLVAMTLAMIALALTGCHDGYSTYNLNYRSRPHLHGHHEHYPLPRSHHPHHGHHGHGHNGHGHHH